MFAVEETKWVKSYREKCNAKIEEINVQLEKHVDDLAQKNFTGKLFVTFESEMEAKLAKSHL